MYNAVTSKFWMELKITDNRKLFFKVVQCTSTYMNVLPSNWTQTAHKRMETRTQNYVRNFSIHTFIVQWLLHTHATAVKFHLNLAFVHARRKGVSVWVCVLDVWAGEVGNSASTLICWEALYINTYWIVRERALVCVRPHRALYDFIILLYFLCLYIKTENNE